MHFRTFALLLPLLLSLLTGCLKDDDYTTSPSDRLSFSTDTVAFDTILSGTPTNTYVFTVYNRADKAIRIPQVALERGAESPFKVNADGMPLANGTGTDFEIRAKDSMTVYLMVNMPDTGVDDPVKTEDKLLFTTEAGTTDKVVLTASGQSVIPLTGERIKGYKKLDAKRPYRIMDSLVVEDGATLTIGEGVRLYFHPQAELIVYGTLSIEGTGEHPVELRGDRLGNMFAGQPYDRIPGQWGGITFKESSYDNYISYADIHSGSYGIRADSSDVEKPKLLVENSVIHNVTHHGLDVRMCNVYVGNSQITNAGGDCVHVRGGDVSLIHCTIARFFYFRGGDGVALDFANYDGAIRLPLTRLLVANSIITGMHDDDLMGSQNKEYEADAFAYLFTHCLLNTPKPKEDNPALQECLWDDGEYELNTLSYLGSTRGNRSGKSAKTEDDDGTTGPVKREDNFVPAFDLDALTFEFYLSPYSQAVGTADAAITTETYPLDRTGKPRGAAPDLGCYQHNNPNP